MKVSGANSPTVYYEVTNAQHFDAFLGFPGYSSRLVPLHRYYIQAMDMMYANLKTGAALPASQVARQVELRVEPRVEPRAARPAAVLLFRVCPPQALPTRACLCWPSSC